MEGEEGVTEAEGGVTEAEGGVTEAEGGVTEAEAGNMEAKGGITEPHLEEAADCEGGLTEAREVAREMECVAGHNIVHQLRSIVSSFLCPTIHVPSEGSETEYWNRNACINLQCGQCGVGKFRSSLCEVYELADPALNNRTLKWQRYEYVVLPTGRRVEHESHVTDDFHAGGDHETLSDTLAVGDVFAVKADDEEMEYWLLRCTTRKHKIIEKEEFQLATSAPLLYFVKLFTWMLPEPLNGVQK
ncbi:hypothetical protein R1flu_018532 [Riccia fluitans]|uniref:Uncharacterized protein n=1 Tax=Riccia fluitans TaxID=41844 RepID=A0ABD1ZK20_9MARC